MYRCSITFLQAVIVLICVGVFAFLLFEPPHEGHNAHATLFEIYFKDPFLAYAYLASIPFLRRTIRHSRCWATCGRREHSRR